MSKESLRKINLIYKTVMLTGAAALAVTAIIYNPFHLFTAGMWVAFTLESEFVERKDGGIEYE